MVVGHVGGWVGRVGRWENDVLRVCVCVCVCVFVAVQKCISKCVAVGE